MSAEKVKLESVRRKTGGRVHLTPRVPTSGSVTTLCGQTLSDGSYLAVEAAPDCAHCGRRARDPARISGAFFAQEAGSELLRLSLERARTRPPSLSGEPGTAARSEPEKPVVWPEPKSPAPALPDRLGELVRRGFKPSGEGVWRSPQGVIVRMTRRAGRWRFAELICEGSVIATRTEAGVRIRAGDVEVRPVETGYEVELRTR